MISVKCKSKRKNENPKFGPEIEKPVARNLDGTFSHVERDKSTYSLCNVFIDNLGFTGDINYVIPIRAVTSQEVEYPCTIIDPLGSPTPQ